MSGSIRVLRDVDLRPYNTFGVSLRAPWLVEVDDAAALPAAFASAPLAGSVPLVLGGGSNLLLVGAPDVPVLRDSEREVTMELPEDIEPGFYTALALVEDSRSGLLVGDLAFEVE